MYAIVDIAGKQYKVTKNQKIFVHRIEGDLGASVDFDQVLLIENDKDVIVGEPVIQGAMVSGKILSHTKGDKVKVFKKKRRKGYKVLKGHRQLFTEVEIEKIQEKGAKKAQPAAKAAPKASPKTDKKAASKAAPKTASKKAPKAAPKATPEKKATAAKPAAKKPAGTKPAAKKPAAKKPAAKSTAAKPKTATKPAAKKTTGDKGKTAGTAKKPAGGTKDKKEE